ncbi:hypothetical protein PVAG01_10443 [Phlyctema vagabunda]|uniref:Cytochrome P450 n=1 Tax=Phlyctema vagabunda TaxID=108571 RepID=A0ABR4P5Y5_9HELO
MIQKQKTLSFRPFLQITAWKHGDATEDTYHKFGGDLGDDLSRYIRLSLAPGPHLDEQNLRMGKRLILEFEDLLNARGSGRAQMYLLEWSRRAVVQASSCGVYGEQHPFLDPEVEKSLWEWMNYLTMHLIAGLDIRGKGAKLPEDASHLAREHQRTLREAGVCDLDNAKQASIFTIAAFSNSAPTLYWTIWELFSRPEILAEVRQEIMTQAVSGSKKEGFVLDVAVVKTRCPLLVSVFQETQRTRHVNASFRMVMEDTVLDGKYLLKKGNFLQMPGAPIHSNTGIWGHAASEFDPYRFVPKKGSGRDSLPTNNGFMAWGAAPYLCPARQFATTEILIVAAMMAIRVDLLPIEGSWDKNPAVSFVELSTLLNPMKDSKLDIQVREEWEGSWSLKMGESLSRVSLASG